MSKRQFKSQASSSRAVSGAGFGGFGAGSSSSTLSYLTEPPNLVSISDANVVVSLKNLSKKDGTTKAKALEDLRAYVQAHPYEQEGGPEEALLEAWVKLYPRISIDNSRRVRELSHYLQYDFLNAARRRMEKHIPKIVGSWLAGTYDRDRAVSKAASDGITSFLDNEEKVLAFWRRCQTQILDYAQEALDETPQSLSDERTMTADDVQAKYFRVITSSVSLVVNLLSKLKPEDIAKQQDKYESFLSGNKKVWAIASSEDSFARRTVDQLLVICLDRQKAIMEADTELLSHAFISEALKSSQSSSALQLVQGLTKLTSRLPVVWTSAYKGKRTPLSRLRNFVEKGSQGGPAAYWQTLQQLVTILPDEVVPSTLETSLEFLAALRSGINSRDESRSNTAEAWSTYLETVHVFLKHTSLAAGRGQICQEAVYPIFQQYLSPASDSSMWSVGNHLSILSKAFDLCGSAEEADLVTQFSDEWQKLSDAFIQRLQTSLPEQSKDYHKSQSSIAAESQRWFGLFYEILGRDKSNKQEDVLITISHKIISTSLLALANRNGKPYSAAAAVEASLRVSPSFIIKSPPSVSAIKTFLQNDFPKLIISPSRTYLVSVLNLFRAIPDQDAFAQSVWQTTIDGLLPLPDNEEKLKAIEALVSSHAASTLAQNHPALQDWLLATSSTAVKASESTHTWALFETVVGFDLFTERNWNAFVQSTLDLLEVEHGVTLRALAALETISKRRPEVLRKHNEVYVSLITKLLALMEMSDPIINSRALALRNIVDSNNTTEGQTLETGSPMVKVIQENLETASPQSLSIDTLVAQANQILDGSKDSSTLMSILPDLVQWRQSLFPLSDLPLSPALGVLRPFAGCVFLAQSPGSYAPNRPSRDLNGYSTLLRQALYTAHIIQNSLEAVPAEQQVDILYLLSMTSRLVQDQIDLHEENKLFASSTNAYISEDMQNFIALVGELNTQLASKGSDWLEVTESSVVVHNFITRLLEDTSTNTPVSYHSSRILASLLQNLVNNQGWHNVRGEAWLQKFDILKTSTQNVFGAAALLIGLQDVLSTSKTVNNLCNRLVSDVAGASSQAEMKTLVILVLLNASFTVYEEGDLPVAHNRLVFAVKQILSWTDGLASTNPRLAAEACHSLHRLLPSIKDVYGPYWETSLSLCISIWESNVDGKLSNEKAPAIGMSLKLYNILRNLPANDDLEEALVEMGDRISQSLIKLLQLQRPKESVPILFVDDLLSRETAQIPLTHVMKDELEFYSLIGSDSRAVQSATFDILHRILPEIQQQRSVDVLLEKKKGELPEELLSLLLNSPKISDFDDDALAEFPSPIRSYLLSWLLVYDHFSAAAYNLRDDYSIQLKSENYITPLLDLLFDILGHSSGHALNLITFDPSTIRTFDIWAATEAESSERAMRLLLVHLYYLCLKYTPSLAKSWWMDCKSKQTRIAVESWTEKFYSPLVIQDTIDEVSRWAEEQQPATDENELIVKVSKRSREVFAGYEVDETMMQIVIRLPTVYPLEGVKVEGVNRVAVSEKKWNSWLMIVQGVITFSNGSITDGLTIFRKNVTGALKGQTECAICYSIISSDRKMPDKRCQTCKNLFHSSCLFKWFASSNQSTCPLCRNPFNYGTDTTRRRAV